jgi:hypothetical protein
METLFGGSIKNKVISGADFSEDGLYRFALWRIWDELKPLVMFIGLNPSTANAKTDDATIRRVRTIATNLGYGGVYMCNCLSFISTNPEMLQSESLEAMMRNAKTMSRTAERCKDVIFAWGNFEIVRRTGVDKTLAERFPNALALHINKNGSPKHPLYCKSDIRPVTINQRSNWECALGAIAGALIIWWKLIDFIIDRIKLTAALADAIWSRRRELYDARKAKQESN